MENNSIKNSLDIESHLNSNCLNMNSVQHCAGCRCNDKEHKELLPSYASLEMKYREEIDRLKTELQERSKQCKERQELQPSYASLEMKYREEIDRLKKELQERSKQCKERQELQPSYASLEMKYREEIDRLKKELQERSKHCLPRNDRGTWRIGPFASDSLVSNAGPSSFVNGYEKQECFPNRSGDSFVPTWKRDHMVTNPTESEAILARFTNGDRNEDMGHSDGDHILSPWKRCRITTDFPSDMTPTKFIIGVSDFISFDDTTEWPGRNTKELDTKDSIDVFGSTDEINVQVHSQDEDENENVSEQKISKLLVDNAVNCSKNLVQLETWDSLHSQKQSFIPVKGKYVPPPLRQLLKEKPLSNHEINDRKQIEFSQDEFRLHHSNAHQSNGVDAQQALHETGKDIKHSNDYKDVDIQGNSLFLTNTGFTKNTIQNGEENILQNQRGLSGDNDSIKLKLDIHATIETYEKHSSLKDTLTNSTEYSAEKKEAKVNMNANRYQIFSKYNEDQPYQKHMFTSTNPENFWWQSGYNNGGFSFLGKSKASSQSNRPKEQKSRGRRSFPCDGLSSWREKNLPSESTFNKADYSISEIRTTSYKPGFIDTHCHLDFLFHKAKHEGKHTNFQANCVGDEIYPVSYEGCVAVFCQPWTFKRLSWWQDFLEEPNVWAAFGCHPHYSDAFGEDEEANLRIALWNLKTVALGEIGLDYSSRNRHQPEVQKTVFRRQLKIALEFKKPLVIHCRDAERDCLDILKEIVPRDYYIHRHCFTEDWEEAKKWLSAFDNLYFGITALVTCKNTDRTQKIKNVVRQMPLDRLLLETDAPYFRPYCFQNSGRLSNPGMAIHVAAQVATIRNKSVQEVLQQTRRNTKNMYGI